MFVKGSITLTKGFATWKKMVHENESKMKEMGMTMVFAGTEAFDDTKLHVIMHFNSPEGLQQFKDDEELTKAREEAGVVVESGIMTPITTEAFTNFPGPI